MAEKRSGVSRSTMGLDADTLQRVTNDAFLGSLEQANQRLELLARIIAEFGMKPLLLKMHRLLLENQKERRAAKIKGEWVFVSPAEWRERDDMTVNVGLGTGNKQGQALALDKILELQGAMVAQGGMDRLVTEQNIFNTASRLVEIAGLHNPEKYFLDPSKNPQQQQQPQGPNSEDLDKQIIALQAQANKTKAEGIIQKLQLDNKELMLKHQREVTELQAKLIEKDKELDIKKQDSDTKAIKVVVDSVLKERELQIENDAQLNSAVNALMPEGE
jgi:hypothetical protein